MKNFLLLAAILATSIHAETEKEFCERVAKAWNSKNATEILALYGDPAKLDPESLTVVITKGMETGPVFKKTVNTSKGAIIPIESPKP